TISHDSKQRFVGDAVHANFVDWAVLEEDGGMADGLPYLSVNGQDGLLPVLKPVTIYRWLAPPLPGSSETAIASWSFAGFTTWSVMVRIGNSPNKKAPRERGFLNII